MSDQKTGASGICRKWRRVQRRELGQGRKSGQHNQTQFYTNSHRLGGTLGYHASRLPQAL